MRSKSRPHFFAVLISNLNNFLKSLKLVNPDYGHSSRTVNGQLPDGEFQSLEFNIGVQLKNRQAVPSRGGNLKVL
jgi:hypothetical protein